MSLTAHQFAQIVARGGLAVLTLEAPAHLMHLDDARAVAVEYAEGRLDKGQPVGGEVAADRLEKFGLVDGAGAIRVEDPK